MIRWMEFEHECLNNKTFLNLQERKKRGDLCEQGQSIFINFETSQTHHLHPNHRKSDPPYHPECHHCHRQCLHHPEFRHYHHRCLPYPWCLQVNLDLLVWNVDIILNNETKSKVLNSPSLSSSSSSSLGIPRKRADWDIVHEWSVCQLQGLANQCESRVIWIL